MSQRSFIEINHDYCHEASADEAVGGMLRAYLRSGDSAHLWNGFHRIDQRHHSERVVAARRGYAPAQDELDIEEIAKIISGAPYPSSRSRKKAREVFQFLTAAKEPREG